MESYLYYTCIFLDAGFSHSEKTEFRVFGIFRKKGRIGWGCRAMRKTLLFEYQCGRLWISPTNVFHCLSSPRHVHSYEYNPTRTLPLSQPLLPKRISLALSHWTVIGNTKTNQYTDKTKKMIMKVSVSLEHLQQKYECEQVHDQRWIDIRWSIVPQRDRWRWRSRG